MRLSTGVVMVAVISAVSVSAAVVTVPFEGIIDISDNASIPASTRFAGTFTYESAISPNFSGPDFSSYSLPAGSLTVALGSTTILTSPITVANVVENFGNQLGLTFSLAPPSDHFAMAGSVGTNGIQSMLVMFAAADSSVLSGTALPSTFPALSSFSGVELILTDAQGRTIGGHIVLQPVPEPKSVIPVVAALFVFGWFMRYRVPHA
jgi:hypothetical protein